MTKLFHEEICRRYCGHTCERFRGVRGHEHCNFGAKR